MRILDQDNDKSINGISVLLTTDEAKELLDSLKQLLETPANNHAHIPDKSFKKEITIAIYAEGSTAGFDKRTERLILADK